MFGLLLIYIMGDWLCMELVLCNVDVKVGNGVLLKVYHLKAVNPWLRRGLFTQCNLKDMFCFYWQEKRV